MTICHAVWTKFIVAYFMKHMEKIKWFVVASHTKHNKRTDKHSLFRFCWISEFSDHISLGRAEQQQTDLWMVLKDMFFHQTNFSWIKSTIGACTAQYAVYTNYIYFMLASNIEQRISMTREYTIGLKEAHEKCWHKIQIKIKITHQIVSASLFLVGTNWKWEAVYSITSLFIHLFVVMK